MPFGQNLATCFKCGKGYITGDCIDLLGTCDECNIDTVTRTPCKEIDLTHLTAPVMKEKLKQEIQAIMNDALAGVVDIYRYKDNEGVSYIRWGRVQKHINEAIDLYWPKENKKDE
jgi:hypothetical protein